MFCSYIAHIYHIQMASLHVCARGIIIILFIFIGGGGRQSFLAP